MKIPVRHAWNCYSDCQQCLDEHIYLAHFLLKSTNTTPIQFDILSQYRKYLDKNNIESEGMDGWGNENAFDPDNMQNFINWFSGG